MDVIEVVALVYEISIAYVISGCIWEEKTRKKSSVQKYQQSFVTDMAHNLQTPLAIARAEVDLMAQDVGERMCIVSIRKSLIRMSDFIRRMLEIVRIEGCIKPVRDVINLSVLVEEEIGYIETMAEQYDVSVTATIEEGVYIQGNRKDLSDVIINIAHNAIKYRREGIVSTLHVTLRTSASSVELSFADNGIGIDPKDVPHIFERLYKVDPQSEGFGLGLALVKSIVENHQGTIEVVSTVGEGSIVTIRFPGSSR